MSKYKVGGMLDYHEMMIIVNQIVFKDKWT